MPSNQRVISENLVCSGCVSFTVSASGGVPRNRAVFRQHVRACVKDRARCCRIKACLASVFASGHSLSPASHLGQQPLAAMWSARRHHDGKPEGEETPAKCDLQVKLLKDMNGFRRAPTQTF